MKRLPTEERRKQIAEAALRIIAERGLREFTIAAISEEVGLADGTIFRHFDDKDDIILEAVGRLEAALTAQEEQPSGDALERLGVFLRRRVALIQERPEVLRLLFSDDLAKAGPEEAERRVRELKHRSMRWVRDLLDEAIDQELIRQDCTADELLYLVHGTALAIVFSGDDFAAVTEERLDADKIWESVERLLRAPRAND